MRRAVLGLCLLAACTVVKPVSQERWIEGHRADQVVLALAQPFSFEHLGITYALPAGRYQPIWQDSEGVYFKAPEWLLVSRFLNPTYFRDGGLYLRTDGPAEVKAYVFVRLVPMLLGLPSDFRYSIDARDMNACAASPTR